MTQEPSGQREADSSNIDKVIQSISSASLGELMSIWRARAHEQGTGCPSIFRCLGERILAHGEPLLAYDVVSASLKIWPNDVRLRQLQGLALSRSGATERANAILESLRRENNTEEETLGLLGRTYKDLAANAATRKQRKEFLKSAAKIYGQAYQNSRGYWSGINAATTTLLIGEGDRARNLATKVRKQCFKAVEDSRGDLYWEFAVLGEASLVCRDFKQAGEWYARAAEKGSGRYGDLDSSRRNARLILKHWNEDPRWIDKYLCVPSVVVFTGHMVDRPDRGEPRFPEELASTVAAEIQQKLDKLQPGFAFSSAACGSDILFLEAMLDRGAEVSIVLPYNEEEFVRDSVEIVPRGDWRGRFDRVLARAARVVTASNQRLEIGVVSYEFCNELMLGLAAIRARQLGTQLIPLAVWDGKPGDGPGGAASGVQKWRRLGYDPEIVCLSKLKGGAPPRIKRRRLMVKRPSKRPEFRSRIVAILFADAVGFSKLSEAQVPQFFHHFLGSIADLTKTFSKSIIAKNTWGDGLYFVFSDVQVAGNFALQLADLVTKTEWEKKGLRPELNLRIALHAGPVYEVHDPITKRISFTGTHVSRAARIEPITPPGQVYASEAFAALSAAKRVLDFTCDYVGQTPMAKGYGTLPTYHVRPKSLSLRL